MMTESIVSYGMFLGQANDRPLESGPDRGLWIFKSRPELLFG